MLPSELDGEGTESSPYQIGTLEELQSASYDTSAHYELVSDIDASTTQSMNTVLQEFIGYGGWTIDNPTTYSPIVEGSVDVWLDDELVDPSLYTVDHQEGQLTFNESVGSWDQYVYIDYAVDETAMGFSPIGTGYIPDGHPFTGTFNGNGHTIDGMYIWRPENVGYNGSGMGLFAAVQDGKVENVNVENSTIIGADYIGAIAGDIQGEGRVVENCSASLSIPEDSLDVSPSASSIGGVAGNIRNENCIVHSCESTCSFNINDDAEYVGGITGYSSGEVRNSTSSFECYGGARVGGIVGSSLSGGGVYGCESSVYIESPSKRLGGINGGSGGDMEDCVSTGEVRALDNGESEPDYKATGGLAGQHDGEMQYCETDVYVVNEAGPGQTGGIAGYCPGDVINTTSYGDVVGEGSVGGAFGRANGDYENVKSEGTTTARSGNVGGLVGVLEDNTLGRSSSSGTVEMEAVDYNPRAGGLVGLMDSNPTVEGCSSSCDVVGGGCSRGGLIGEINVGDVSSSYATGDVVVEEGVIEGMTVSIAVGGLVGEGGLSNVEYCYSTGRVEGGNELGGLMGYNGSTVIECYSSTNVVPTSDVEDLGSFIGSHNSSAPTGCYVDGDKAADMDIVGDNQGTLDTSEVGVLTTSEMTGSVAEDNMPMFSYGNNWRTTSSFPIPSYIIPSSINVRFTVSDSDGAPIEGDIVGVNGQPLAQTDSSGIANVTIPYSEDYTFNWITAGAEKEPDEYNANMQVSFQYLEVSGQVTNVDGEPVEGEALVFDNILMVETDENGEYSTGEMPPRYYEIEWPGGGTSVYGGDPEGGKTTTDIQYAGMEVGIEHPLTGEPMQNAIIQIDTNIFRTDDEGKVRLNEIAPGSYNINAMGFWSTETGDLSQGDMYEKNFADEEMDITIGVDVESRSGAEPLEGIDVNLTGVNARGETDETGHCELFGKGLDGGETLMVAMNDPRYETVAREVDATKDRENFDITLETRSPMER